MDSLVPRRDSGDGGNEVTKRIVNMLLTEMDGLNDRKDVWIIGATNRPDIIDRAIIRPGRLDNAIYVPLPKPEVWWFSSFFTFRSLSLLTLFVLQERVKILQTQCKSIPLDKDVDLVALGLDKRCTGKSLVCKPVTCSTLTDTHIGFSGADLHALVREAAMSRLREYFESRSAVTVISHQD